MCQLARLFECQLRHTPGDAAGRHVADRSEAQCNGRQTDQPRLAVDCSADQPGERCMIKPARGAVVDLQRQLVRPGGIDEREDGACEVGYLNH